MPVVLEDGRRLRRPSGERWAAPVARWPAAAAPRPAVVPAAPLPLTTAPSPAAQPPAVRAAMHAQAWDADAAVVFDERSGLTRCLRSPGQPAAPLPAPVRWQDLAAARPAGAARPSAHAPSHLSAAPSAASPSRTLGQLPRKALAQALAAGTLRLATGPFVLQLHSPLAGLARDLAIACAHQPLAPADGFADIHLSVQAAGLPRWRPWAGPRHVGLQDGRALLPASADPALVVLERALSAAVAAQAHQFLILRAAVLERGGLALLLPAPPGGGKSTLAAALALRGWRLMSDDLALYDMASGLVHGLPRPLVLDGPSAQALQGLGAAPGALALSPLRRGEGGRQRTLLAVPAASLARQQEPAWPAWVVQPRWTGGGLLATAADGACLAPLASADTFMLLAEQGLNYPLQGLRGFHALGSLLDQCHDSRGHRLVYRTLPQALALLEHLTAKPPVPRPRPC